MPLVSPPDMDPDPGGDPAGHAERLEVEIQLEGRAPQAGPGSVRHRY